MQDWETLKPLLEKGKRIFFIGIGGKSLSVLAELAVAHGLSVAGSDQQLGERALRLKPKLEAFYEGHAAASIDAFKPDVLVYSPAVSESNPERQRAQALGIPCLNRADWLGLVNRQFAHVINIAGTHGKSTTTGLCALIFTIAGLDPTVHLGADLEAFGGNTRLGQDFGYMVSEACEFKNSFLSFYSTCAAVLNLAHDHVDFFPSMDDVIQSFARFVCQLAPGSRLVLPSFDPAIVDLRAACEQRLPGHFDRLKLLSFGAQDELFFGEEPSLAFSQWHEELGESHLRLHYQGQILGDFVLKIPGRFNVDNAMAAALIGLEHGATADQLRLAFQQFTGVKGRFSLEGEAHGVFLINDYAHHPDSVAKTIAAAKAYTKGRLFACFQPITYSRVRLQEAAYVDALKDEAHSYILEAYDDREQDHSYSAKHICDGINAQGGTCHFAKDLDGLEAALRAELQAGDTLLLMGHDICSLSDRIKKGAPL